MNFRSCPRMAPFRYTFSLAVSSGSNPAPTSISGAMVPLVMTFPSVGFSTPAIIFNRVDFPAPLRPPRPTISPFCTLKLTWESATKSLYRSLPFTNFMTYSLMESTRSTIRLKCIDTSLTSITVSFINLPQT